MKRLELKITPEGEQLITDVRGLGVLRYPLLNKGTGFTQEERRQLDIEGLLPSQCNCIPCRGRWFQRVSRGSGP